MKKAYIIGAAWACLTLAACGNQTKGGEATAGDSVQATADTVADSNKAILDQVNRIYAEVNRRYAPNYQYKEGEKSLEEMFCTEEWQEVYDKVMDIDSEGEGEGFFVNGFDVWTMGSSDAPFQLADLKVKSVKGDQAEVTFDIRPAESEGGSVYLMLKKEKGQWRVQDFIQVEEDYEYDMLKHMKEHIAQHGNSKPSSEEAMQRQALAGEWLGTSGDTPLVFTLEMDGNELDVTYCAFEGSTVGEFDPDCTYKNGTLTIEDSRFPTHYLKATLRLDNRGDLVGTYQTKLGAIKDSGPLTMRKGDAEDE